MTQSILTGCGGAINVSTATTSWFGSFGAQSPNANTTESDVKVKFRCGTATMKNMRVYVGINTRNTSNSTGFVNQNGVSAMSATITSNLAGTYTDTGSTPSVADTDNMTCGLTTGSGTGNIQTTGQIVEVATTGQGASQMSAIGSAANATARFYPFAGALNALLEPASVFPTIESTTLSNMQFVLPVNSSTGFTVASRKNQAAGGQSVVVGSGATGLFEDTGNHDTMVSGDTMDLSKPVASGSATLTCISMKSSGSVAGQTTVNAASQFTLASATTRYFPPYGTLGISSETQAQVPMAFTAQASKLSVYVQTNASAAGTTVVWHNGGAGSSPSIAVGTGTGLIQDTSGTAQVSAGDLISYVASGSNNNILFNWAGAIITQPAAANTGTLMLLGVGS